jgi:acetolactate decarboxylase
MKTVRRLVLIVLLSLCLAGSSLSAAAPGVLFQTSTLQALSRGVYDGDLTFADLAKQGNFGLGTLNGLDGEMIGVNGRFYQIKSDGQAYPVVGAAKTPFAMVTFFRPQKTLSLDKPLNLGETEKYLETLFPSKNLLYAIKIEGIFPYIKARSVPRQTKPYPPLAEAAKQETISEFHNVKGIIVGFRLPDYLKNINLPGYHFHFLTADRQAGGHVYDWRLQKARISIDTMDKVHLRLPRTEAFSQTDLSTERQGEIDKVEKGPGQK